MKTYTKYYNLAGVTIQVISDLPILDHTFDPKFKLFEVQDPGNDIISIHHHFEPKVPFQAQSWEKVYDKSPWRIYRTGKGWVYERIHRFRDRNRHYCTAFFNHSHTRADIYNKPIAKELFLTGRNEALTLFPTDQLLLARILADRNGCFFHSNGMVFKKRGLLFMGHSGYGKSTLAKMLSSHGGKPISDDRTIVQSTGDGIKMHGSWCHGKENFFSRNTFFLDAVFFLTRSDTNEIVRSDHHKSNLYQLISFIIKPLVTKEWWDRNLSLLGSIVKKIPCYNLSFDKSGRIVDLINKLY